MTVHCQPILGGIKNMDLIQKLIEIIFTFVFPLAVVLGFFSLVAFFYTERVILILRLRRKEHRKEIIKRYFARKKRMKAWHKTVQKNLERQVNPKTNPYPPRK